MAGVTEAKAGMLGLNPVTLALGATLGVLVMAGKSAMEIAQSQAAAEGQLTNALADRNAMAGKVMPLSTQATHAIAKATAAHAKAVADLAAAQEGRYIPATHLSTLQTMRLEDAQRRVAEATGKTHYNAARRLAELQVEYASKVHGATTQVGSLAAAQQRVADTAKTLATLQATVGQKIVLTGINARDVKNELYDFIQANRDYISNQEDVIGMTTLLVREGVSLRDLTRDQALAMDLAAAKGIPLAAAAELVAKAQAGQFKGLKDLLGIATPTIAAGDSLAEKQKKIGVAMDTAAGKVKGASKAITDQKKALNDLGNDWHDFAVGPGGDLNRAFTNALQLADLFYQFLAKGGIQVELIDLANAIVRMVPGLQLMFDLYGLAKAGPTIVGATVGSLAPTLPQNRLGASTVGGKRPPHNVTINVNGTHHPQAVARAVTQQLRRVTAL